MGLQITDKYFVHIPESVININGTTIMKEIAGYNRLNNTSKPTWYNTAR